MLPSWLKSAFRPPVGNSRRRPEQLRQRYRPLVEALEDRTAPATLTVTNTTDTGVANDGSLRGEILGAASGDTIVFASGLSGTINLDPLKGSLILNKNLTIAGPGASVITVNGNRTFTIFQVNAAVADTINSLTISGGADNFLAGTQSGGIQNLGTLSLSSDVFNNNQTSAIPLNGQTSGAAIGNNAGATLTVNSCTFLNGTTPPASGAGDSAGIDNQGLLTVQNSTFTGNTGHNSGGIDNRGNGNLTVTGCAFNNNVGNFLLPAGAIRNNSSVTVSIANSSFNGNSSSDGEAIVNDGGGTMVITGSIFSRNTGTGSVIVNGDTTGPGTLTLTNSVLTGNTATTGTVTSISTLTVNTCYLGKNTVNNAFGGGAFTLNASFGTFTDTIANTTIANNQNGPGGLAGAGGIQSGDDTLTLIMSNVTIAGNATSGGGAGGFGAFSGKALLTNVTITGNKSQGNAGGISQFSSAVRMTNTLVAGNQNAGGNGDINGDTPNPVNGPNLALNCIVGNGTGFNGRYAATNCQVGTAAAPINPLLAPLAYYGGPILPGGMGQLTVALLPGSPAINGGTFSNNNGVAVPVTDERGFGRVGLPDIGAFESQGFALTILSGNNQQGLALNPFFQPLVVQLTSNNPLEPVTGGQITFTGPPQGGLTPFVTFANGQTTITVTVSTPTSPNVGIASVLVIAGINPGSVQVVAGIPNGTPVTFNLFIVEPIFAVGADAGTLPEVKVYDAQSNTLRFDFFAFAPSFRGGVRVAVGDVEANGIFDIICAAGPGGGPEVRVFSGRDGSLIQDFFAFAPTFAGGVYVAAGDVNGDGHADIICGAGAGGGPQVTVFSGKDFTQLASFYAFPASFTGGVRVAAGDISGTGHADIICGAGPGGSPEVTVFSGTTFTILNAFFAFPANFAGGVYVAAGDLTHSGRASIIVGAGEGGLPEITIFDGTSFQLTRAFFGATQQQMKVDSPVSPAGVRVAVDCESCPHAQIITGLSAFSSPQVDAFDATNLQLLNNFFAFNPLYQGGIFVGGA
jgi:hypothetical protein